MSAPTIGAYFSAFNIVVNNLDYESSLRSALSFFDFVTVAVNTSTDDTLARLQAWAATEPRLKVVSTNLSYDDITFDGRVKDAALQACEANVLTQLDLDEFVPLNQRALWREYAAKLLVSPVDCFMIPSVDLWSSMDTIRADVAIGNKFRLHKRGLHRGVWKEAWRDGRTHIDTSRSDSCELLTANDDLASAAMVVPLQYCHPATHHMLNGYPFSVHTGYVSFDQRIKVNKAIWAEHWRLRSGHHENVAVDKIALEHYPVIKHRLNLT